MKEHMRTRAFLVQPAQSSNAGKNSSAERTERCISGPPGMCGWFQATGRTSKNSGVSRASESSSNPGCPQSMLTSLWADTTPLWQKEKQHSKSRHTFVPISQTRCWGIIEIMQLFLSQPRLCHNWSISRTPSTKVQVNRMGSCRQDHRFQNSPTTVTWIVNTLTRALRFGECPSSCSFPIFLPGTTGQRDTSEYPGTITILVSLRLVHVAQQRSSEFVSGTWFRLKVSQSHLS